MAYEPSLENENHPTNLPESTEGLKEVDLLRFELNPNFSNKETFTLFRPSGTQYYTVVDQGDPAVIRLVERTPMKDVFRDGSRVIEANLDSAHKFICDGDLAELMVYFASWKEIKGRLDITEQKVTHHSGFELSDWYTEVTPGYIEYLRFMDTRDLEEIKKECLEKTLKQWFVKAITTRDQYFSNYNLPNGGSICIEDRYGDYSLTKNGVKTVLSLNELENTIRAEFDLKTVDEDDGWSDDLSL